LVIGYWLLFNVFNCVAGKNDCLHIYNEVKDTYGW